MSGIKYVIGDATQPELIPNKINMICHCCNTIGAWGAGFVVSLGNKYPIAKLKYQTTIDEAKKTRKNLLGTVAYVKVTETPDLIVAHLFGQSSIYQKSDGTPPVDYNAIVCGFNNIICDLNGKGCAIHMPRIGCGLAGGDWSKIEDIINQTLIKAGIDVIVYNLPDNKPVTYRSIDKEIEKEIAKYCDKHIYCGDIQFERCNNTELQKSGVDGYLTIPSLGITKALTDEKAGAHYVNSPIKTYLMELSQITKAGKQVDGWFLSENNKTEYYILMYLWAQVPQYEKDGKMVSEWQKISENNITLIEYYLVKKSDIFKYLEDCGFTKDRLKAAVEYLRSHPETDRVTTNHGFKFVISRGFKECPVNLCIEKKVYNKICKLHRFVGKYDYESLT